MPNPDNSFEHLQSVILHVHNREVRRYYSETDDDNITTSRGSVKAASIVKDDDSALIVALRLFLFWIIVRKLRDSTDIVFGVPIEDYQQTFRYRPQITLMFYEKAEDVDPNYYPVSGEISFRIMNESSSSLSEANLRSLALKIKSTFATPRYRWRKGKDCYSYRDPEKGYQLKIFARTEADAKDLIDKTLSIQNHTPDWDLLRVNSAPSASSAFPTNPGSQSILGKSRRKPRRRPIADVYFVGAVAKIHGIVKPIYLVDATGFHWDALETTW